MASHGRSRNEVDRRERRFSALCELVETEKNLIRDMQMVIELFLLPVQLLGNAKIADTMFGDLVKITTLNRAMYADIADKMGPLIGLVDPERMQRIEKSSAKSEKVRLASSYSLLPPPALPLRRKSQNDLRTASSSSSSSSASLNDPRQWSKEQTLQVAETICIGDVMVKHLQSFPDIYARQTASYDKAVAFLKLLRKNSPWLSLYAGIASSAQQQALLRLIVASEQNPRTRRLPLESFLVAPIKRIMHYKMPLAQLLDSTPENHADYDSLCMALSTARSVATEVDRQSGSLVNQHRLAELQRIFDWSHLLDGIHSQLDTYTGLVGKRRCISRGPLQNATTGDELYVILFNDFMILFAQNRSIGSFGRPRSYGKVIQAYDLLVRNETSDGVFELINLGFSETLRLRADSETEAVAWVSSIKETSEFCYGVASEAISQGIPISKTNFISTQAYRQQILSRHVSPRPPCFKMK
ncbi:Intersectin 1 (SH3 domain protein) [Coemansia sp. Benny D115]|nr:Intersectin 1 (SH3 domain protein) [Coemansia sp. Benny D115]